MGCVSYCDSSLLSHDLVNCGEYKLGGISAIIVGACGTTVADPSSAVEIQALLDAGTAKLIEDIRFALPAGSPVTVDSPIGCGTPIRINEDRTATLYDANVTDANSLAKGDLGSIGLNLPEDASFCINTLTLVIGATERPIARS